MKRFLIIGMLLGALSAAVFFLYVDQRIVARLNYERPNQIPSVYSEAFSISAGGDTYLSVLRSELAARSYRSVPLPPTKPGEYQIGATRATVFGREFVDAEGHVQKPAPISLTLDGERAHNTSRAPLYLEPQLIAHLGSGEMRASTYTELKDIPLPMQRAVIAIEDERFYHHHGIDFTGIVRAMAANLKALRLVQGGSTLTQQLAKNLLFTPERSIERKLFEMAAAVSLELRHSKEQILELYLNEVYLGQEGSISVHGVAEAARLFFGKKLNELTISEEALLAGIIQAPSAYSPFRNLKRAVRRRDVVLAKMRDLAFITEAQQSAAKLQRIRITEHTPHRGRLAPYFIETLYKELSGAFNVPEAMLTGLRVYTGLNRSMQLCAEEAVNKQLAKLEETHRALRAEHRRIEAALVAIEPFSGKVRAWVGGRDFADSQFDHAAQALRQIGSTVKPFVYLTALDRNLNNYRPATPLTVLPDEPLKFDMQGQPSWEPENYDRKFRGDVTLRYAIENSLNMPTAYIATRVGLPAVVRTLKAFHVSENVLAVPSLALGAADTNLLRLTAGYAALANSGTYVAPRLYLSAVDDDLRLLAHSELKEERVASENAVYVLTNIMQGVLDRGTATSVRRAGFTRQAAGKTGTSNDTRDAWFVAFTPALVVGVWVGFDDNSPTGLTGAQGAAPIWTHFMKCSESLQEPMHFIPPPGVIFENVDSKSGGIAGTSCPTENVTREVFVRGTEPIEACSLHSRYGDETHPHSRVVARSTEEPARRKKSFWDVLWGD